MNKLIRQAAANYRRLSIWLICGMTLPFLLSLSVSQSNLSVVLPLVISVIFSIVVSIAYVSAWKYVASTSPTQLSKFYMAAMLLRVLAGAMVLLSYCLISRQRDNILHFTIVFSIFYVVMLVFDTAYFARIEKKNALNNQK